MLRFLRLYSAVSLFNCAQYRAYSCTQYISIGCKVIFFLLCRLRLPVSLGKKIFYSIQGLTTPSTKYESTCKCLHGIRGAKQRAWEVLSNGEYMQRSCLMRSSRIEWEIWLSWTVYRVSKQHSGRAKHL